MKLNQYSKYVTVFATNTQKYIFYKGEIISYYVKCANKFYIEEGTKRKTSVMEYIKNTYEYKHSNASIDVCYCLTNLIQ